MEDNNELEKKMSENGDDVKDKGKQLGGFRTMPFILG